MLARAWFAAGLAGGLLAVVALAQAPPPADPHVLTEGERRKVLRHGPWPPAPVRDPGNRVSGTAAGIELGELLFFDKRLSGDGSMACEDCHRVGRDWTDGRERGVGKAILDRNTPSLWNVGHQTWFGWDGGGDSLWMQSLRPIGDPREMDLDAGALAARVRGDADLSCRYGRAFGVAPSAMDDKAILVATGKALAAFQETLVSGRTPFDAFRDALEKGDRAAMDRYPSAALRGLKTFVGKGNCATCHFGPLFATGEFADIGVPFFVEPGRVDAARRGGIERLLDSPFNLLGRHNDDLARANATRTRHVEPLHRNFGEFRVPSLRNVARTAPYMHAGSHASLRAVVAHYSELDLDRLHQDGEKVLQPLHLTDREVDDLIAFLDGLGDSGEAWTARPRSPC